jgi:beta-fructofuranosidase
VGPYTRQPPPSTRPAAPRCGGWIQENLPLLVQLQLPRVGALSLPRVAELVEGRLALRPAPELVALRERNPLAGPVDVAGRVTLVDTYREPRIEVAARITGRSGSGKWDIGPARVEVDLTRGALSVGAGAQAPVNGPLRDAELRIFVDGSIVEVFLPGRASVTARCYGPPGGSVVAESPGLAVHGCTVWRMPTRSVT